MKALYIVCRWGHKCLYGVVIIDGVKLTEKQKRFIDYYIQFANGKEAAIKAGYSKKTADVIAAQNLIKLKKHIDDKLKKKIMPA